MAKGVKHYKKDGTEFKGTVTKCLTVDIYILIKLILKQV